MDEKGKEGKEGNRMGENGMEGLRRKGRGRERWKTKEEQGRE